MVVLHDDTKSHPSLFSLSLCLKGSLLNPMGAVIDRVIAQQQAVLDLTNFIEDKLQKQMKTLLHLGINYCLYEEERIHFHPFS